MNLAYTFEVVYFFGVILYSIFDKNINNQNLEKKMKRYVLNLIKSVVLLIIIMLILSIIAYFHSSIIHSSSINFVNQISVNQTIFVIVSPPLQCSLLLIFLMFSRLIFYGLLIALISTVFSKKTYVGFLIVCACISALGFNSVYKLTKINVFPFQYSSAEHLSYIFGDSVINTFDLNPVSIVSAISYFLSIILITIILLYIVSKKASKYVCTSNLTTFHSFRSYFFTRIVSKSTWFSGVILALTLPYIYYFVIPFELTNGLYSFQLFTEIFVIGNYLIRYFAPLVIIGLFSIKTYEDILPYSASKKNNAKIQFNIIIVNMLMVLVAILTTFITTFLLANLLKPFNGIDWSILLQCLLRFYIVGLIYYFFGLVILLFTGNYNAAIGLPLVTCMYSIGGIYKLFGREFENFVYRYLPNVSDLMRIDYMWADWTNILFSYLLVIISLVIYYKGGKR